MTVSPPTVTRPARTSSSAARREATPGVGEVLREAHRRRLPYARGGPRRSSTATLADAGEPAFRARQVWEWAARGAAGYEAMTTSRARCASSSPRAVPFSTLALEHEAHVARRHGQGAVPHRRRPPGRGRAHALPRRAALAVRVLAVRLPADLHVLRDGRDEVRPQPHRVGDPRPGAALPPHRAASTTSCSWAWASR